MKNQPENQTAEPAHSDPTCPRIAVYYGVTYLAFALVSVAYISRDCVGLTVGAIIVGMSIGYLHGRDLIFIPNELTRAAAHEPEVETDAS